MSSRAIPFTTLTVVSESVQKWTQAILKYNSLIVMVVGVMID